MKKLISSLLIAGLSVAMLAGCSSSGADSDATSTAEGTTQVSAADIKIGVIYIGDENEGYTESHMKGIDQMMEDLGISEDQVIEKTTIPESEECYDAAVDLAEQGCDIIFGTSFGHEDYIKQAAEEFPEIQFCHATGYQAASSGLSNMHNYFDNIYEARYVSGVVAGLKLNEMIEAGEVTEDACKIGYVGAYPYAEVVSGYTAFYLGVKSVCDSATMEVQYTNSWADISKEKETADALIADGCVLISQHADTTGAPSACEEKGVPCVGYNVDMTSVAATTALTSSTNNWAVYYDYAVSCVLNGEAIATDWSEGFASDAVALTTLGDACAERTQDKVDEVIAAIKDGSLKVFDTSTFTIGGKSIEDLIAEGGDYASYEQYVSDGVFQESTVISAPAFDLRIDGITELTTE
ncbi:BMP family ABC transporter substrate-binding protein [Eubacterium oxidoreducens]|uniref:Basic membrane protein A n=1 Tax=Eubacterium oxidoreducens TaxID=1732 RepID=A0A1G6C464_EUBOX|nr:BMP family ABC transporter substrate-binding protein [Eubacterium oxidoreducens]SDB27661.1 basic membrane protein A [Eubacterium oxidoreducens]